MTVSPDDVLSEPDGVFDRLRLGSRLRLYVGSHDRNRFAWVLLTFFGDHLDCAEASCPEVFLYSFYGCEGGSP